jgi:GMP synthase-like glutamine amidotransferase
VLVADPATYRLYRDGVVSLGLLMLGHVPRSLAAVHGDYPELFAKLLAPHGVQLEVFAVDERRLPASLDDCDGWIGSPSRSSVLGDDPWLPDARELVGAIVEAERPFAGICFGHQLLGQAAGGRVERAEAGWGVGAHRYEVVAPRPWMDPAAPGGAFTLIASHEDQVVELPPGATLLAGNDHCPNALFAIGERAFGLQPHPEFTAAISSELVGARRDLLGEARADAALASLAGPLDRDLIATWIGRFFTAF